MHRWSASVVIQIDEWVDQKERELSADTLAILGAFYSEKEQNERQFEDMKAQMEQQCLQAPLSMDLFSEDWNASQFWYSDETANRLAEQLLHGTAAESRIAVVSAPSVFVQMKNLLVGDFKDFLLGKRLTNN